MFTNFSSGVYKQGALIANSTGQVLYVGPNMHLALGDVITSRTDKGDVKGKEKMVTI